MFKKLNLLFDQPNNSGAIDGKMDSLFLKKNYLLRCQGCLFLQNWVGGSHIVSIAKTASKKKGASIRSMKFLSSEAAFCFYKSNIWPCMEYCCHVWAGALSCYLDMLYKLQKQVYKTILVPQLLSLMNPSSKCSQFKSFLQVLPLYICSSELSDLVPFHLSHGSSTDYSNRLHDFSVTIPRWNGWPCQQFLLLQSQNLEFLTCRMLSFDR